MSATTRDGHFELELVLHVQTVVSRVGRGIKGVIVGGVAVHVHRAVAGAGKDTASKTAAPSEVGIDDEAKIAGAIIRKRSVERDGRPVASSEGNNTFIHLVFRHGSDPVGGAGKFRLTGVHHVNLDQRRLFCSSIVEGNAVDSASSANLISSVKLL